MLRVGVGKTRGGDGLVTRFVGVGVTWGFGEVLALGWGVGVWRDRTGKSPRGVMAGLGTGRILIAGKVMAIGGWLGASALRVDPMPR